MNVQVRIDPESERKMWVAARTCYSAMEPEELWAMSKAYPVDPSTTTEAMEKLIRRLAHDGHLSVLEHMTMFITVGGVSRALTHQLVRHRVATYSQQSQRYVSEAGKQFEYVIPPSFEGQLVTAWGDEMTAAIFMQRIMEQVQQWYDILAKAGLPNEDCRFVLPNATCTNICFTINLHELIEMCKQRLCFRAQWEIRELFMAVRARVIEGYPFLSDFLGPKCLHGPCPETDKCAKGKKTWMEICQETFPGARGLTKEEAAAHQKFISERSTVVKQVYPPGGKGKHEAE